MIFIGTAEAAHLGQYAECCSLLVQCGAELETSDTSNGRTASHWAVYYHRSDILAVLIDAGKPPSPATKSIIVIHTCTIE